MTFEYNYTIFIVTDFSTIFKNYLIFLVALVLFIMVTVCILKPVVMCYGLLILQIEYP